MNPTQIQPTEVEVTPADVMRGAAVYLERHGWIQGDLYALPGDPTPPACATGALAMAAYGEPVTEPYAIDRPESREFVRAVEFLTDYIDQTDLTAVIDPASAGYDVDWGRPTVADWNDTAEQTADEVITTLRAAADEWDHTHGGAR